MGDSLPTLPHYNQALIQPFFGSVDLQSPHFLWTSQTEESNQAELALLKFFTGFLFYSVQCRVA